MGSKIHNFDLVKFGENLRKARKAKYKAEGKYKTQELFAEALGCSVETVRNWEQGRTPPETGTLFLIAELLDCDLDYLTGRIERPTHDLEFITDQLGLSEEAVKKIMRMSKSQVKSISEIIEHPKFGRMTEQVKNLKDKQALNDATAALVINHVLKGMDDKKAAPVHENMIEQAIIYNLSNLFTQIVCDITETEL